MANDGGGGVKLREDCEKKNTRKGRILIFFEPEKWGDKKFLV